MFVSVCCCVFHETANETEAVTQFDPSARSAILIAAGRYGGLAGYDSLRARYLVADNAVEKRRLMNAMAEAVTAPMIARTLDFCMSVRDVTQCDGHSVSLCFVSLPLFFFPFVLSPHTHFLSAYPIPS